MNKKIYLPITFILLLASFASQSQNIGIGTSSPQQKLHVAGNVRVDAMAGPSSGLVTANSNGDLVRLNFSGNANETLRGDGSFGVVPSGSLPSGAIIASAKFPDSGLLKAGYSYLGEQSSNYSTFRSFPGGVSDQYLMLPTYENGNAAATPSPQARSYSSFAWTGNDLLIWGGLKVTATTGYQFLNDGAKYNPNTDSWTPISTINAPIKRGFASSVWTGTEMIVWGGTESLNENFNSPSFTFTNTGGRYNPTTNTWTATSTINAPSPRTQAAAVWTGTVMVVFGGNTSNSTVNTGGRYNPTTNTWTATSTLNAPTPDFSQTRMFWDAAQGLVYVLGESITAARYNPVTNVWSSMASVPSPYNKSCAVWVGSQLWVYANNNKIYQYNGATNTWATVTPIGAGFPAKFSAISAVWTGFDIVFFGCSYNDDDVVTGNYFYRYSAAGNSFTQDQIQYNHLVRDGAALINAGTMVIKWGGYNNDVSTGIPNYTFYPEGLRYYTVGGLSFPTAYFKVASSNVLHLYRKN